MSRRAASLLRALRPKQWTKNAVVLAALVFAVGDRNQHLDLATAWVAVLAAVLFCLGSSAVYLLNDIRDVELDRAHPTKRFRPIAAGEVGIPAAAGLAALLALAALAGAWAITPFFFAVVAGYLLLQLAYTLALKRIALVDMFVIATGFVLRALGGAVAIRVTISPWLLVCTLMLAMFLALCKRRHEKVVVSPTAGDTRPSLQGYDEKLLDILIAITGGATMVCYALYTLAPDTVHKFGTQHLAFTIPFVMFGIFRYLDLVYRHELGGRPEHILLTDPPLLVDILLYGAAVLAIVAAHRG